MKLRRLHVKRPIKCLITVLLIFSMNILRIYSIQQNRALSIVSDIQSVRSVQLSSNRGYIYDRNLIPLVNETKINMGYGISGITDNDILSLDLETKDIGCGIKVFSTENMICSNNDIKNYYIVERYQEDTLCDHIIGYLDSDGNGVCGIEKAYNRLLIEEGGEISLDFSVDASGIILPGSGPYERIVNYDSPAGISLTIDSRIQKIVETALKNSVIDVGAVVVMDCKTFEIIAISSIPSFECSDIASSIDAENQPFFNRAFGAYPVGSVFKPFVAAAALESGIEFRNYECSGMVQLGTNIFSCYNNNAHGIEDLNKAIEKSCNSYFINLAINTGADNIISTASAFGFGKEQSFCSSLISQSGNLPTKESLSSPSAIANLSFGQGELLATPVQIASAYSVLANNGNYIEPKLLKYLVNSDGEIYADYRSEQYYRVCSEETCIAINSCLYNNMLNGTGTSAQPSNITSAGKTATAQTGKYDEDGNEILCTWFAGFFPFENPQYTVVVFNENGSTASVDCAPVFKEIAERIAYEKITG